MDIKLSPELVALFDKPIGELTDAEFATVERLSQLVDFEPAVAFSRVTFRQLFDMLSDTTLEETTKNA